LGADLTVAEGQMATKEAILDILAIVKEDLGNLDTIIGVDNLNGFVRSAPTFTKQPQVIDDASDLLIAIFGEDGMIWVSWPKKASKVATDVTEDVVRREALSMKLVDVKVCAVDEVWSGLKLVIRKNLRS
jgi:hypothetical protein